MIDISVSGLTIEFEVGRKILDGLTFQVDQGERVGLLGRNGAGKTTLLRILTGELLPDGTRKRLGVSPDCPPPQRAQGSHEDGAAIGWWLPSGIFLSTPCTARKSAGIGGTKSRGWWTASSSLSAPAPLSRSVLSWTACMKKSYPRSNSTLRKS